MVCNDCLLENFQLNLHFLSNSRRAPDLLHVDLDEVLVVVHHGGLQCIEHELEEVVRVGGLEDVSRSRSLELSVLRMGSVLAEVTLRSLEERRGFQDKRDSDQGSVIVRRGEQCPCCLHL